MVGIIEPAETRDHQSQSDDDGSSHDAGQEPAIPSQLCHNL